jgi:hypothetical protein
VRQPILTPDRFAIWFNSLIPGAHRSITAQDIRDMTRCGLIGRYGYYGRVDIETVRAVLQYEQLRHDSDKQTDAVRMCKRCGGLLPESEGVGRPREYCSDCEKNRGRERWRKWYKKEISRYIR